MKFKNIFYFLIPLFILSCNQKDIVEKSPSGASAPDHQLWTDLLGLYVQEDGMIDYASFKEDKRLNDYLELLKKAHPDQNWSREERLAHWINAYNAFTIKLLTEHYPVESIKDIPKRWSKEFVEIEGLRYSLGDIEHNVLRKLYKEPRIHFALNCASFSCPKLSQEAYSAELIEDQLNRAAMDFINDTLRNKIKRDKMQLSKIFSWFKSDFTDSSSLKEHLKKYSAVEIDEATKIEYLEYNWKLNDIVRDKP